jgi:hypothetical protein
MSRTTLILSALITVGFILMMAPNVFVMNRGKVLRNIAAWLAIIAALALIYNNFGPESKNPIIPASPALSGIGKPSLSGHDIKGTAAPEPVPQTPAETKPDEKK